MELEDPRVFAGRATETQLLQEQNWRSHAPLIVIYGRRRVGKTALVEHAFRSQCLWKFEGIEGASTQTQIKSFLDRLSTYTPKSVQKDSETTDWDGVFKCLKLALSKQGKKETIVFLDEFQWMANMDEGLVSLFKVYWDNDFQKIKNCRFIICGSISSFIVKKVLQSKALYGRVDIEINLQPLGPSEIRSFFPNRTPREVLDIALTVGGVPRYLETLTPHLSLQQNLDEHFFKPTGFFFQEFNRLFISHFGKSPLYKALIESLLAGPRSLDQLALACGVAKGAGLLSKVEDLVLGGFVERSIPFDKKTKSKLLRYRILDEYLHFYFTFVVPNAPAITNHHFSSQQIALTTLRQWQGYAFERFCRRHSLMIADTLRFSGVGFVAGPWFTRDNAHAQCDLVFKRNDRMLTVCELKYVSRLNGPTLVRDFERRLTLLRDAFPDHGVQKVLILAMPVSIPKTVQAYFDKILIAEDIFWKE